jgi:hypothetical protein
MKVSFLPSFLPDLEYLTPDGRWRLLQEWLDDNPAFKARVDAWAPMTPDEVFPELREIAAQWFERKYGALAGAIARAAEMDDRMGAWIATLQQCYKDRKEEDSKHVKHVKHVRRNPTRRAKTGI